MSSTEDGFERQLRKTLRILGVTAAIATITYLCLTKGRNCIAGRHSLDWPTANGRIESIAFEGILSDSDGSIEGFQVDLRYVYLVGDESFESDRWSFDSNRISVSDYQEARTRYKAGANCEVHYDPAAAGDAVLITGSQHSTALVAVISLIVSFIVYGIFASAASWIVIVYYVVVILWLYAAVYYRRLRSWIGR